VIRSFPIRVSGHSGRLPNETNWEEITESAGSKMPIAEYTSVTKTLRRVARFDAEVVRRALEVNRPTHVVLNHLDYIGGVDVEGPRDPSRVIDFVKGVESSIGRRVDYFGFGPKSVESASVVKVDCTEQSVRIMSAV